MLDPAFQLGPFTIPIYLLALVASFFLATAIMRRDLDRAGSNGKQLVDFIWTGFLIGLLVQRFGGVLLHPTLLFKNPFQALLAVPAPYMAWAGWMGGGLFVGWKIWRTNQVSRSNLWSVLNLSVSGVLIGLAVSQLLMGDLGKPTSPPWGFVVGSYTYHPLHLYRGIGFLLLGLGIRSRFVAVEQRLGGALFGVGVIGMMVSFFDFPNQQWLGMSSLQAGSLLAAMFGLLLLWRKRV